MPRLNIRIEDNLHRQIHSELPHGLQERLLKNLIKMALAGTVNPSHIAVDNEGEYIIVKKENANESTRGLEQS
jgi:hypothetical protein